MTGRKGVLLYGVGTNDSNYPTRKTEKVGGKRVDVWVCPFYDRWRKMLSRCYSKQTYLTYKECYVCEEWLYFSNFKVWMQTQDWEGKHLDKDLLVFGNKVYSPETCCFLPPKINHFLTENQRTSGGLPAGVTFSKTEKKYVATCSKQGKTFRIGAFPTISQARQEYLNYKHSIAVKLSETVTCSRQKEALLTRYKREE